MISDMGDYERLNHQQIPSVTSVVEEKASMVHDKSQVSRNDK